MPSSLASSCTRIDKGNSSRTGLRSPGMAATRVYIVVFSMILQVPSIADGDQPGCRQLRRFYQESDPPPHRKAFRVVDWKATGAASTARRLGPAVIDSRASPRRAGPFLPSLGYIGLRPLPGVPRWASGRGRLGLGF